MKRIKSGLAALLALCLALGMASALAETAGTLSGKFALADLQALMDDARAALGDSALPEAMSDRVLASCGMESDAVSVATWEELKAALGGERDICVDADIAAPEPFGVSGKTLWIGEGVTLSLPDMELKLTDGAVLVNEGTLLGSVALAPEATFINGETGTWTGSGTSAKDIASLWTERDSLVVNYGKMDLGNAACLRAGSLMVNLGELRAYDFSLLGGHLVNAGQLTLPENLPGGGTVAVGEEDPGAELGLYNAAVLYNRGTVTVQPRSMLVSHSRVINEGLLEGFGYRDYNTIEGVFENRGVIRMAEDAQFGAAIFGTGVYEGPFDFSKGYIILWTVKPTDAPQDAVFVSDADALRQAMKEELPVEDDNQLRMAMEKPVILTGEVTLTSKLEVTRPLYILGSLNADEAAAITVNNVPVFLCEGGALEASKIDVCGDNNSWRGAEIYIDKGSSLTVRPGGALRLLGGSVLCGQDGDVSIQGASLTIEGLFVPDRLASFNADNAEITVCDGARFMPPYQNVFAANGLRLTLKQGSRAELPSDTMLTGAQITVREAPLVMTGANVLLSDCDVTLNKEGSITFINSRVSLTRNTQLVNSVRNSWIEFFGGDEHWVKATGEASIVNSGEVVMDIRGEFETPVKNEGTFLYNPAVYGEEGFTAIKGHAAKTR